MLKYALLFLFISLSLFADQVRVYDPDDLAISASTNTTYSLFVEEPSGDATSESAPAKVYVPMENASGTNKNYFYLNANSGTKNIFGYGSVTSTYSGYNILFPLSVSVSSTAKYIYAAVKMPSASNYKVVARTAVTYQDITNQGINFSLSPHKICESSTSETTNCSNFDIDGTITEATKSFYIYFFLSDNSTLVNSSIAVSSYSGGVYFQTYMSNRVYSYTDLVVSMTGLRRGDERVIGDYTNSATMEDFKKALIYGHTSVGADACSNSTILACAGSLYSTPEVTTQSGSFTLPNLTNGVEVRVSVVLIDKYGFSTHVSNSKTATPADIEELLNKQSCFLLTAGFGEEHFVIDYFRGFRDRTLLKSTLGRAFVKFYYKFAPGFAVSIYNNDFVRFAIRQMAYVLYGVFNYFYLILISLLGLLSFYSLRKIKS